MTPQLKTTAEKLRYYRKACALTHRQVAEALNIERSTYTRYERGNSSPSLSTITKIAAIFNISPLMLLPEQQSTEEENHSLQGSRQADSPIYQLAKDERGLVALYRVLNKEQKQEALELIGNLSKKD